MMPTSAYGVDYLGWGEQGQGCDIFLCTWLKSSGCPNALGGLCITLPFALVVQSAECYAQKPIRRQIIIRTNVI